MPRPLVVILSASLLVGCNTLRTAERGLGSTIDAPELEVALAQRERIMTALRESVGRAAGDQDTSLGWDDPDTNLQVFLSGATYINAQCTNYLNALQEYQKMLNRARGYTSNTGLTAATILPLSNVATDTIGIVAAAFGLAVSQIDVTQNTLLLGATSATLRRLVSQAQYSYLKEVRRRQDELVSRSAVEIELQGYLEICTPVSLLNMVEQALNNDQARVEGTTVTISSDESSSGRTTRQADATVPPGKEGQPGGTTATDKPDAPGSTTETGEDDPPP